MYNLDKYVVIDIVKVKLLHNTKSSIIFTHITIGVSLNERHTSKESVW